MADFTIFNNTLEPWILKFTGDITRLFSVGQLYSDIKIVPLKAENMRSTDKLFDELTSALQFPVHFGRNFNALDECITDLDWLQAKGYLLIIQNSNELLDDEQIDVLAGFLSILNNAGYEWSQAIDLGEDWDRPALPFHVILQVNSEDEVSFDEKMLNIGFSVTAFDF